MPRTKEEKNAYQREWYARRIASDPEYRDYQTSRCKKIKDLRHSKDHPKYEERLAKKREDYNRKMLNPTFRDTKKVIRNSWKHANPEKVRNSAYKRYYGITLDQFNEMLEKQNGVCAICLQPNKTVDPRNKRVTHLHVDHNHETNKVRGLLCDLCNKGLGSFKDNISSLESAIQYLIKHNQH